MDTAEPGTPANPSGLIRQLLSDIPPLTDAWPRRQKHPLASGHPQSQSG